MTITRRVADFFEKMSVASFAIGLFQARGMAIAFGIVSLTVSLILTCKASKEG